MDNYTSLQGSRDAKYAQVYNEWLATLSPGEVAQMATMGLDKPHVDPRCTHRTELDDTRASTSAFSGDDDDDDDWLDTDFDELDESEEIDEDEETLGERCASYTHSNPSTTNPLAEALKTVVSLLVSLPEQRLTSDCLAIAVRITGSSIEQTARARSTPIERVTDRLTAVNEALEFPGMGDAERLLTQGVLRKLVSQLATQRNIALTVDCLALTTGLLYQGESETSIAKRHGTTRACVSKRCVELTKRLGIQPSLAMRTEKARAIYSESQLNKTPKKAA